MQSETNKGTTAIAGVGRIHRPTNPMAAAQHSTRGPMQLDQIANESMVV